MTEAVADEVGHALTAEVAHGLALAGRLRRQPRGVRGVQGDQHLADLRRVRRLAQVRGGGGRARQPGLPDGLPGVRVPARRARDRYQVA